MAYRTHTCRSSIPFPSFVCIRSEGGSKASLWKAVAKANTAQEELNNPIDRLRRMLSKYGSKVRACTREQSVLAG